LTLTGVVQLWMILVLAFLNGTALSFDQPARGALIPMLVPKEDLMNAISLQTMLFNGASAFGPALAGVAVGLIGYAGNFFLNAASFTGVLLALYVMRVPRGQSQQQNFLAAIRTTLEVVRRDEVLPWVLSGYAMLLFLGPSSSLLLPVYAVKVLHVGPERMGLLFSCAGVGAILGAVALASLGDARRKGLIFFCGILLWVTALTGFGVSRWFYAAMAALVVFGVGQMVTGATTITLLQTRVPEIMRGRVMSLNTLLNMGVRPLGDFPAGALIAVIGAPETVLLGAGLVGVYGVFLFMTRGAVRAA